MRGICTDVQFSASTETGRQKSSSGDCCHMHGTGERWRDVDRQRHRVCATTRCLTLSSLHDAGATAPRIPVCEPVQSEYESVVSDAKITSLLQRGRRARTGIVNRKHPNQSPRLYVMAATREQRLCPVLNFLIQSARTWMVAALPTRTECGSTQCESRVVAGSQGHRCARPLDG